MLTQVQSSLPEAFNFRRYPKYRTQPVCEPYRSQCIRCLFCFAKWNEKKMWTWKDLAIKKNTVLPFFFHSLWSDHLVCNIAGIQRVPILQTWQQTGPHGRHHLWKCEHELIQETMKRFQPQLCTVLMCVWGGGVWGVFHRELGGEEVPTFADSTAPTSACAMRRSAAAPWWAAATCRCTKLTSPKSRRRTMCQATAGVSPATTGRSLQRQLSRRRNSSCGLDGTTRQKNARL